MTDFNLQEIDHLLKDFKLLPKEALAAISDDDLEEYEKQFEIYRVKTTEDRTLRDAVALEVRTKVAELFGSTSNQTRYFERNLNNQEDIVSKHSNKFTSPERISEQVHEARAKYSIASDASGAGVNENTMEEIDDSIKYLLGKGMEFGKDFAAHNAVDIANGLNTESVLDWADKFGGDEQYSLDGLILDCNNVVGVFNYDNSTFSDLWDGNIQIYDDYYDAEIKLKGGSPCISLVGEL